MNTRKLIALLTAASLALISGPVFASCNDLTVTLKAKDREIQRSVTCNHGEVKSNHRRKVILTNSGAYGPDCRFAIVDSQGNLKATLDIQQNYCGLEAGTVTVTPQNGETPVYKKHEGSYWDGKGGNVEITGFKPNSQ